MPSRTLKLSEELSADLAFNEGTYLCVLVVTTVIGVIVCCFRCLLYTTEFGVTGVTDRVILSALIAAFHILGT